MISYDSRSHTRRSGGQLLWLDDEPDELERLCAMIRRYEIGVVVEGTYHAARKQMEHASYDLIITDLKLDRKDGFAFRDYAYERVAATAQRHIHVGAVTNYYKLFEDRLEKDPFLFVYEKGDLVNGKTKSLLEDCIFAVADSLLVRQFTGLMEPETTSVPDGDAFTIHTVDIGYVLGIESGEVWARIWRCGNPKLRTIRVFPADLLGGVGIATVGQPFVVNTFRGTIKSSQLTEIRSLGGIGGYNLVPLVEEAEIERFREKGPQ